MSFVKAKLIGFLVLVFVLYAHRLRDEPGDPSYCSQLSAQLVPGHRGCIYTRLSLSRCPLGANLCNTFQLSSKKQTRSTNLY